MDKKRFVEIAPTYYALAICAYFRNHRATAYRDEIKEYFTIPDTEEEPEYCYLAFDDMFERAVTWLSERGVLTALLDDFGPPIYASTEQFDDSWELLSQDRSLPFHKYMVGHKAESWLNSALLSLNKHYIELGIQPSDFENPDEQWEPLPLDQNDPHLQQAITALEAVTEQVRADNGYNANLPGERNYVLAGLNSTITTLKQSAVTSVQYLKVFALEPLAAIMQRFRGAALSVAAAAARDAIIEFLKQHGVKLLENIVRQL